MKGKVMASDVASYLGEQLIGKDIPLYGCKSASAASDFTIAYISNLVFKENMAVHALYLIRPKKTLPASSACSYVRAKNPRLAYARIIQQFFPQESSIGVAASATIGTNVNLGADVSIGESCVIADNVSIGSGTKLHAGVVIGYGTQIGCNCIIRAGSVIGEDGFEYQRDENGCPIRIRHFGRVIMQDGVEIGAKNTIARGTTEDTVIHADVKTDDQVHIAHNCKIGKNTIIAACAEISGSVTIGTGCWLAPNCSIINGVHIGDNVKIGIGTVIVGNVTDGTVMMGLDGLPLRQLVATKKRMGWGPRRTGG
ncbi:MAG: UDP-3-O-(3-hydroxymyristoyl)glucosamine N-acyltransferase [Pseudomonadota bacterium]